MLKLNGFFEIRLLLLKIRSHRSFAIVFLDCWVILGLQWIQMCLWDSSSTHHELGSSFNAVLTPVVLLILKVSSAVHSPAQPHVYPCLCAFPSVGILLSGHQNLKCMNMLIYFLLAMPKYLTRSYLMGRFILAQFGGTVKQDRDKDEMVAGASPAVEAGMQGYNSWKYQKAERRQDVGRATNLKVYPQVFWLGPTSQRFPEPPRQCRQVGTKCSSH